jgi:hypothetical protein
MKTAKIEKALRSDKGGIAFGHDADGGKVRLPVGDESPNLFVYGPTGRTTVAAVLIQGAVNRGIPVHLALPTAEHRAFRPVTDKAHSVSQGFGDVADHLEALLASAEERAAEAQAAAGTITAGGTTGWTAPLRLLVVVSDLDRIMAPVTAVSSPAAELAEPQAEAADRARAALAFVRLARISDVARMTLVATSIADPAAYLDWAGGDDLLNTPTVALGHSSTVGSAFLEDDSSGRPVTCWYIPRSWEI